MINRYTLYLSLLLLLPACSHIQNTNDTAQHDAELPAKMAAQDSASNNQVEPMKDILPVIVPRPIINLTEEMLLEFLTAEFSGQRGDVKTALDHYVALAYETQDPLVIERAVVISIHTKDYNTAHDLATFWRGIDPNNTSVYEFLVIIALRQSKLDDVLNYMRVFLNEVDGLTDQKLWIMAHTLAQEQDRQSSLDILQRLREDYKNDADRLYIFALIVARFGEVEQAQKQLEQILTIQPDHEATVIAYINLLQQQSDNQNSEPVLTWVKQAVNDNPDSFNLRMIYARLLLDNNQLDSAEEQFKKLEKMAPQNQDVIYVLGLIYLRHEQYQKAKSYFQKLTQKEQYGVHYYLGRIAEENDDIEAAIKHYQLVLNGNYYANSQVRLGFIYAQKGQTDKAIALLRGSNINKESDRYILIQAESEILIEAKRYDEAMALFDQTIKENQHPDLLYARAMLAEKIDMLDIAEQDLKAILIQDPNHATALNALGYTLAERTDRHQEAYGYIRRAYELRPNDSYILDSMGWVLYRLGKFDEAIEFLQKAIAIKHDPEIAAHLGEVLWAIGEHKKALKVWKKGLKRTPDDDHLKSV